MRIDDDAQTMVGCGLMIFLIAIGFGSCCWICNKSNENHPAKLELVTPEEPTNYVFTISNASSKEITVTLPTARITGREYVITNR